MRTLALFLFWLGLVAAIIGGYNHFKLTTKNTSDLQSHIEREKRQREYYREKRVARPYHSSTSGSFGNSARTASKAGFQLMVRNGGLAAMLISFLLYFLPSGNSKGKTTQSLETAESTNDQDGF